MKHVQTVVIVLLVGTLAGTVGWALSERTARLAAEADKQNEISSLKSSLAVLETKQNQSAKRTKELRDSVAQLEKWRNGAESRLAAAARKRDQPGLFRDLKHFMPAKAGKMMALDAKRTQRYALKDKKGNLVNVSLMGAATVGPEIAKWMGLDEGKRRQLNELITGENERYAQQLVARNGDAKARGFNFGLGGGDDGWMDFVNGEKMKKLLTAEQREQLLLKFPRRCTMHMITAGPGGVNATRVILRGLPGMNPEGKMPPAPPQTKEQF